MPGASGDGALRVVRAPSGDIALHNFRPGFPVGFFGVLYSLLCPPFAMFLVGDSQQSTSGPSSTTIQLVFSGLTNPAQKPAPFTSKVNEIEYLLNPKVWTSHKASTRLQAGLTSTRTQSLNGGHEKGREANNV